MTKSRYLILIMMAFMLAGGCNEIKSGNGNRADRGGITREDFEKQRESFEKEAKQLGGKVGAGAEDLWIWTKTRTALAYADDLRDVTINVAVEDNVVTLTGTVPAMAQKTTAGEIAESIEGVKSVKNELRVSAAGDTNENVNINKKAGS